MNVEKHKELMKKFETMINTADEKLVEELIAPDAVFYTPAAQEPLVGPKGYLSIVYWARKGFSDVRWKLEEMAAEGNVVAVRWTSSGTHDGNFLGLEATGKKFSACVMNFYYFNEDDKICKDIAAEGMLAMLRPLGLCSY